MPNDQQHQVSDLDRVLALKALREYIYLHHPVANAASDFAEDIPALRPYGMFFSDMAPSQSIISRDPIKRQQQIQQAAQGVEHAQDGGNLPANMLRGGLTMGAASIPMSLGFSAASRLLTKGKGGVPRFQPSKTWSNPASRGALMTGLGDDVSDGALWGAGIGAGIPLATHATHPSPDAMNQAASIMQKAPYLTSMPGGDIAAAQNYNKDESKPYQVAKSTATNAALGAGVGAGANLLHYGIQSARTGIQRAMGSTRPMPKFNYKSVGRPGLLGAAIGGGIGMLTSSMLPAQY